MEAEAEVVAQQPVSAQIVGDAFVQQYYHILHHSPGLLYRFYQDISKLGRPEEDGSMSITTTMHAINEKIASQDYSDIKAEIKSVDAQDSFNGGVNVLVTGYLSWKENTVRNFVQSFFLALQDKGYFVLNDMFRYLNNANVNPVVVNEVVVPETSEPILAAPVPVQENHASDQITPSPSVEEEIIAAEVNNPPKNGEVRSIEEEIPVAEVVDEVEDETQLVDDSCAKIVEVPKKSYASIVMHLKESAATFSPPPVAPRKVQPKVFEQLNSAFPPGNDEQASSLEPVDNGNNQEADGYSIYIKGLPMSATEFVLEEVFKKFGAIKSDGIQVRSNRQQGFCFGFVEFEEASSVHKALEASPVTIGGRQALVEEKRSTNSRGNNRGRFQYGRGSGFRSEGTRGRGNYGGGRGYSSRGDYKSGGDFGNRGGNRGTSLNRDGYQRSENVNSSGSQSNRSTGMANSKNVTPRVPATA